MAVPSRSHPSAKTSTKPAAKSRPVKKGAHKASPAGKKKKPANAAKPAPGKSARSKKAAGPSISGPGKAVSAAGQAIKRQASGRPAARTPQATVAAAPVQASAGPLKRPRPAVKPAPPTPPPPRKPLITFTVATRQSALAVAQTELAIDYLRKRLPDYEFNILPLVTTGDRQAEWSLEQEGGKGLFVGELESALLDGRADIAIHSAKDLPTQGTSGLQIAGFLPREDPRDVLVIRKELPRPSSIATGSPRRRLQLQRQFTKATFCEIRGNVETRLNKIAEGLADSTVLAAAGLNRLKITERPGMRFQILPLAVSVPAAGQGAIAVQSRADTAAILAPVLDEVTRRAVILERAFLRRMGGGCHTAFAVHYDGIGVHLFHESCGYQRFAVTPHDALEPARVAERVIESLGLNG